MEFEWDPEKAAANIKRRRVSFAEAASVLEDPLSTTFPDPAHSDEEARFVTMSKASRPEDDLRPEYDFAAMKGGVRGKHVERLRKGSNLVLLDPEVAAAFPSAEAVNEALRGVLQTARAVRQKGGLPNKALQPTSRALPRAKKTKRVGAARG